jgi:hypothetical protein
VLDVPAATTAVLHGMMATLSEVLGGIDGRLAALERHVRESPRAMGQTVEAAVARMAERMEALEGVVTRPAPRDEALHAALEALRQSVDAVAVRPVRDDRLHAAVDTLLDRPFVDDELRAAVARVVADQQSLRNAVGELSTRPVRDDALHMAVAELAAAVTQVAARPEPVVPGPDTELRAAVAELAARPAPGPDTELRAAVAALAARPVHDNELRAAVAALAARPVPGPDTELRAAVAELAARPWPEPDEELRAAVAELAARPAPGPDTELREAVARLAARPLPEPDEELRAAVAHLTALASRPPAGPGPEDPVRLGVASLHERLNVLLDVVSQPAKPDDAVRAGLAAVEDALARLAAAQQAPAEPTGPDPVLLEVGERLRQLEARTAASDEEASNALRLALARLAELSTALDALPDAFPEPPAPTPPDTRVPEQLDVVAAEVAAVRALLADHPAARLTEALAGVQEQVASLVAQPGPGPAMAMVAAGLSERFESRTDGLMGLLDGLTRDLAALASTPAALDRLAERVDAVGAAAAAVPEALAAATAGIPEAVATATAGLPDALAAATAGLPDAVDRSVARFSAAADSLRAELAARLDRLDGLAAAPAELASRVEEFVGVQFAELARREDAVAAALHDLRGTVDQAGVVPAVVDRVREVVEGQQGDVAAMREAVRALFDSVERHGAVSGQVAELLLENRAALSREIETLQGTVAGQSADLAHQVRVALEAASQVDSRIGRVVDDMAQSVRADVQALAATGQDPAHLHAVADRVSESVRRESELLTQRVAALSVAVEALRTMLDAHVEETSNSIGRKATEVGRKLAADLGIRGTGKKPSGSAGGAKGRSLGPGGH